MKVALELQPCCGMRSGIGAYTLELIRRLTQQPDISFQGNLFNFLSRNQGGEVTEGLSFPVRESRILPYGVYRRVWNALPFSYVRLFGPADITHFFNYIVPPRVGGRVVDTVYDLSYLYYPETLEPKNLRRIQKGIGYSVERSDRIVTISRSAKEEILGEFHLPPERVAVIPPSFDTPRPKGNFTPLREKWGIGEKYLLFLGNLEPRKNLIRLMEAFALLKREAGIPHQLVLAGGLGWRYDGILAAPGRLGLEGQVIFTGFVSAQEKAERYAHADVFVFPSLYEGFGIPILEALSLGTPVVCSETSSMPEAGGEGALLIDPLDTGEIAQGIYTLLTDQDLRRRKVEAGLQHAAGFSWEASAAKLLALYREMMS